MIKLNLSQQLKSSQSNHCLLLENTNTVLIHIKQVVCISMRLINHYRASCNVYYLVNGNRHYAEPK